MMTTRNTFFAILIAMSAVFSVGGSAAAQSEDFSPLEDQPAVRNLRQYRTGRFQLQPMVSLTLQDEYSQTFFVGLQASYHLAEWLGIGVFGQFGLGSIDTDLTDQVGSKGNDAADQNDISFPNRNYFSDQVAQWKWAAGAQLNFIPLRGKLAIFQKLFVDTDFHFFAGVAALGLEEREDYAGKTGMAGESGDADCDPLMSSHTEANCSALRRASRVAIAPTFGAGLQMYFNDWVGLNIEWRAFLFSWNASGTDEGNPNGETQDGVIDADDRIFGMHHTLTLGATFYLPTEVEVSK